MGSGAVSLNRQAREVAGRGFPPWSASEWPVVEYESEGTLLVFGSGERVLPLLECLTGRVRGLALVSEKSAAAEASYSGFEVFKTRPARIEGYLGRFRVWAPGPDGAMLDLSLLSPRKDGHFDVILDLGKEPAWRDAIRPPGYVFEPDGDVDAAELAERVVRYKGRFTKPRYVSYSAQACVHQRQGIAGCDRCIDVCPAGAIKLVDDVVNVSYPLCRGCGACTQVCPSGAIEYAAPGGDRLNAEVAALLHRYREAGGTDAFVLFHEGRAEDDALSRCLAWESPTAIPVPLHSVSQAGLETWFGALAHGAAGVGILPASGDGPGRRVLEEQVALAEALGAAVGLTGRPIRLVGRGASSDAPEGLGGASNVQHAVGAMAQGRTKAARLGALLDELAVEMPELGPTPLPEGAPVGDVRVDPARCTLCGACVNLCPQDALALARQGWILAFTEAACVQCGICVNGCPEQAMTLVPRWLGDGTRRRTPRVLHQAGGHGMARCDACGRPFLPKAMLDAAISRIASAWSLKGQKGDLLRYCPACRAEATMREQCITPSPREGRRDAGGRRGDGRPAGVNEDADKA
jgi:ferredoxin